MLPRPFIGNSSNKDFVTHCEQIQVAFVDWDSRLSTRQGYFTERRMQNAEQQMTLKFSDQGEETECIKFQVNFPGVMNLNETWFTQFPYPNY